jgi:hypothetical protein
MEKDKNLKEVNNQQEYFSNHEYMIQSSEIYMDGRPLNDRATKIRETGDVTTRLLEPQELDKRGQFGVEMWRQM